MLCNHPTLTLTFELDLDIFAPDLHAKIQVCTSVRSAGIARRTDRPQIASLAGASVGFERASPVCPVLAQSGQRAGFGRACTWI